MELVSQHVYLFFFFLPFFLVAKKQGSLVSFFYKKNNFFAFLFLFCSFTDVMFFSVETSSTSSNTKN